MKSSTIFPVVAFATMAALPVTVRAAAFQLTPHAREIDEYVTKDLSLHTDNLDNWAIELQNDPGSVGYVIAYAARPRDAQKAAEMIIDYMANVRGIEFERLRTAKGGYRKAPSVELWIVPNGAALPAARPALKRKP